VIVFLRSLIETTSSTGTAPAGIVTHSSVVSPAAVVVPTGAAVVALPAEAVV